MATTGSTHQPSPCRVTTHRGVACARPAFLTDHMLGPMCALHLYHHRRSQRARRNFQIRVSVEDLAALDELARTHHLSRSAAFRRVLHKLPLPRSVADVETYRELRRIGTNINQIAKAQNRGEDLAWPEIRPYLENLHDRLDYFALRVCGEVAPDPEAQP